MTSFTAQEQADLFTVGYREWCLKRWIAVKFSVDADAVMVDQIARKLRTQVKPIRYPSLSGVFVRGRHIA